VPWPWNQLTNPTASRKAARADVNGQGLKSTTRIYPRSRANADPRNATAPTPQVAGEV
jgi:hypothetical protein